MKSVEEIKLLLEKFYDGITSHEEELLIKEFFTYCEDIPEDMIADKEVFNVLIKAEQELMDNIEIPVDLEQELSELIDVEAQKENHVKIWWTWRRISGIAASICIIGTIGVYLMINQPEEEIYTDGILSKRAYIPQTEEEAVKETERALLLMSEKLSQANERFEYAALKLEQLN